MSRKPGWISRKALLLLHQESLAEFGGAPGLRDEGLLDSALFRPRNVYAYRPKSSVAKLAAASAFGLARNHAFVDGNKRIAFLSIGLFLAINGYELVADQIDAIHTMMAMAGGSMDEASLANWIKSNCKRI
jgi:death-on-curing protein